MALFCVLIPGQILSAAVPTLSEENRKNSAAQQASAFCYYGYDSIMAGQRFTPAHRERERAALLSRSLLMELKAKGVFFFLHKEETISHLMWEVTAASLTSQSTLPPAALSKWPPLLLCSQPENEHGGRRNQTGRDVPPRRCSSRPLFVCFGLNRSGEVECSYSVFFFFLDLVHFQFHVSQISSKAKQKLL